MSTYALDAVFRPKSVAVVGARGATICRTRHARYILHPCTPSVGDLAEALIRINAAPVHGAENPAVEN